MRRTEILILGVVALLFLPACSNSPSAPEPEPEPDRWSQTIQSQWSTILPTLHDIATDPTGGMVVVGGAEGGVIFPGLGLIGRGGDNDVFVAKYDADGNFEWGRLSGGDDRDTAEAVAVDTNGDIVVTGRYSTTSVFGNQALVSDGNRDIFVTKYDTNGNMLWVKRAGGAELDMARGIAVTSDNNIVITGVYNHGAWFDNQQIPGSGDDDVFVAMYSSAGDVQWVRGIAGSGDDDANASTVDADDNIYVAGTLRGSLGFDGNVLTSAGGPDGFVASYDKDAQLRWVRQATGTEFVTVAAMTDAPPDLIVVVGRFTGTAVFGGVGMTSKNGNSSFVWAMDASGTTQWLKKFDGTGSSGIRAIKSNHGGGLLLTGYFRESIFIGAAEFTSEGLDDAFIARLSHSGNVRWARRFGGTQSVIGTAVALDAMGNALGAGRFEGNVSFFGENAFVSKDAMYMIKTGPNG